MIRITSADYFRRRRLITCHSITVLVWFVRAVMPTVALQHGWHHFHDPHQYRKQPYKQPTFTIKKAPPTWSLTCSFAGFSHLNARVRLPTCKTSSPNTILPKIIVHGLKKYSLSLSRMILAASRPLCRQVWKQCCSTRIDGIDTY